MKSESSSSSLLSKINSKYILKTILSLAFGNMNSVLKLCRYNKCLLHKLDIIFKNSFKYEIEIKIDYIENYEKDEKDIKCIRGLFLFSDVIWFIIFLIYIILFYVRGTFNDENLKEGYSQKKKDFVDFMDNYILLTYFLFSLAIILMAILLYKHNLFAIKGYIQLLIFIFIFLIDLTHHISYIIKGIYTDQLIKKELLDVIMEYSKNKNPTEEEKKLYHKISNLIWFYGFDTFICIWISLNFIVQILEIMKIIKILCHGRFIEFGETKTIKTIFLNQFKGLNIIKKELPKKFNKLKEKEKNEFIFKKESVKEYQYELNANQINLIYKINKIREDNHISLLNYDKLEKLPEFLINEKTQLIFNDYDNIFKLSKNFYVFKYKINEFQNYINNNQILNIITIETLNEINIIKQNNFEFISIYGNDDSKDISLDIKKPNININGPGIKLDINIDNINTDDKLNEKSERVSVTEICDNEGNEISSNRNIKINEK